ncbi:hypothetical protein FGE21_12425 [Phaeobacter sp. B1627]|nr:hypothetical protein FGE21_12425 [Phaeobacter sp. B1627]
MAQSALAQPDASETGGLLVSFLEDTLSDESRQISVQGLEGAFSSQARIARLTVSDEDGVWLTVEGAELDWNRLALVRGRFSVNRLAAERITIERSPKPVPTDPDLPTPEATPFALPELPVSLEIADLSVGEIILGERLTGQQATLSVAGAMSLADGALETDLRVVRLDRAGDVLTLEISFANASQHLGLDVVLNEAAGGLVSSALDLPGRPDLSLAITGDGPLSDFVAKIGFATDGSDRISGTVALEGVGDIADGAPAGIAFAADLGGNIDPLLRPDFRPFFGPGIRATLNGRTLAGGGLEVETLAVDTRALRLDGALTLNGNVLDTANLTAEIAPPEGQSAVILPVPGADTTVAAITLTLQKTEGTEWNINGAIDQLRTPDVTLDRAVINAAGRLDQSVGFAVDGALDAQLGGLVLSDPALSTALGTELTLSTRLTTDEGADFRLRDLDVQGAGYGARGEIRFAGVENDLKIAADLTLVAEQLDRFSDLAGQTLSGAAQAEVTGHIQPLSGAFGVDLSLTGQDLGAGIEQLTPLLAGESRLALVAARDTSGLRIDKFDLDAAEVSATGHGTLNSGEGILRLDAQLDRVDRFLPNLSGPARLTAEFDRSGDRLDGTVKLRGPSEIAMDLDGGLTLAGEAEFGFEAFVGSPEALVAQLEGAPLTAKGIATRRGGDWSGQADVTAAGGATARVTGGYSEATSNVELSLSALIAHLDHFVPDLSGQATTTLSATRTDGSWQGEGRLTGPGDSSARFDGSFAEASGDVDLDLTANVGDVRAFTQTLGGTASADIAATRRSGAWTAGGSVTGPAGTSANITGSFNEADGAAKVTFDALVQQLQQIVPGLDGVLSAKGQASRANGLWTLDTTADGPLGIDSRISGTWDEGTSLADITARGALRLEGANAFLKPNLLKGLASFDLALRGPAALQSVSGTITTSDAQLVLPQAAQSIDDIVTHIALSNGSALLDLSARPRDGGRIEVSGPVALEAPYNGTIQIGLVDVVLTDNLSYDTSLSGELRLAGPLAGNSRLSGRIDVGETNFNLNTAGGAVSAAPIPPIHHSGQNAAQTATRIRAGLVETSTGGNSSNSDIALDVLISAPNRIFARGRGLNAELGGAITVRGTASNPAPSGQIGLVRGTFDILGRRLTLDEGRVTLLGDLRPNLQFSSTANTEQGTATLEISGRVDSPTIEVTSDPARPSEEALALLLFGDNIQDLSPLALARLAGSALTLSGRGGGAQKALREATGANNIDLGNGNLGLGGYLADNIYTDLNITPEGDSEVTINLDLSKSLTVTGSADSVGTTGVGIFYKRDY